MKHNILLSVLLFLWLGPVKAQHVFQRLTYPYEVREFYLQNGEQIAYIDEGVGPEVLVFIHGENSCLSGKKT